MGTPAFAVPSLRALAAHATLVGVVSQPDRPQGRGLAPRPSPVVAAAADLGVPSSTPATLRTPDAAATIAAWEPDLLVVAAYGKILPRAILGLPRLAPLNVHASLLPRHRGAAPIAAAILAGDATTGVTLMRMTEELDAGDLLLQRALAIAPDDTTASLTDRLGALGADTLVAALALLRGAGLTPEPQDPTAATYAPRLDKESGRVQWAEPAVVIERKVRAFTSWPSAFTRLGGRNVKIHAALVGQASGSGSAAPGTVLAVGESVRVATGDGMIDLLTLQLEGKKALPAPAFARGARLVVGARFDG
jgi:methionyl-tRNA formyltransferase